VRLGLIARFDHRGLGQQTRAVFNALIPYKTLVVNCPSEKPLPSHPEYFPGATIVDRLPTDRDCEQFIEGCTVIYSAETFYNPNFCAIAERMGVKTVLHVNPEFLDRNDRPTVWAAPSMWRYDHLPANRLHLPVPIDTERFRDSRTESNKCRSFVHVVGRPATRDRNGTEDLLASLQYVTAPIRLTLTCQEPGHLEGMLHRFHVPANVELAVRSGDVEDNADLYRGHDVLVLPRRFGGLCLPQQEALGSGLPVVMPDISPNDMLPSEWLVSATHAGSFTVKQNLVDFFSVNHRALAAKVDQFAQDRAFFTQQQELARKLAGSLSWAALKPEYERVLA
jgi:glycosyltransferase involved in cell wall biosynthesis